ncbi:partial Nicotinamide-nucleotide amidohydrolase PncC, partial [uncultured bacterium]
HAVQLGFQVTRHTAVGDNLQDLIALLLEISARADCCICTGGLGPTTDDLTAEAVSKAFKLPLILDEIALKQIERYFVRREREMPASNRKQALLPQGCQRIDNETGTAPGFSLQIGQCWFVFLPGVPSEMMPMFTKQVLPELPQRFELQTKCLVTLRTIGIGESAIQELINGIQIPETVQLGFRAELGEVQTKLLFPPAYSELEKQELIEEVAAVLGDYVFVIDEGNQANKLINVLDRLMQDSQHTLAVSETLSCGLITHLCAGMNWLISSNYSRNQATDLEQLAKDLQHNSGADCVLVQTYQDHDNTYLTTALLTTQGFYTQNQTIAGSLQRQQHQAALIALDLLRRYLQHKL